jgi:outer membrane protein W
MELPQFDCFYYTLSLILQVFYNLSCFALVLKMNQLFHQIQKLKIMKTTKIVIALLMTMFSFGQLSAQGKDRISIGPRGGVNISSVTNVEESQTVTGLVLGLTSTYSFNERTGLTVDALYSVEGYKAPFETYKLRYLQVPVYFDFFFGQLGERFRPKVYAGVSPAFFLGGTLNELDINQPYYSDFIFNVTGGLGFNYRIGNRIWLNTDARAFVGLNDIRHEDVATGEAVNPRTYQFTLGLAYGLAKLEKEEKSNNPN